MHITTYRPGAWNALVTEQALVALPEGSDSDLLRALWDGMARSRDLAELIDLIVAHTGPGLAALPAFGAIVRDDGQVRVAVRGALTVEVETDDGRELISGADLATWTERVLTGSLRLRVRGEDSDLPELPLVSGVVRAAELSLQTDAPAPAEAGGQPDTAVVADSTPAPEVEPEPEIEPETGAEPHAVPAPVIPPEPEAAPAIEEPAPVAETPLPPVPQTPASVAALPVPPLLIPSAGPSFPAAPAVAPAPVPPAPVASAPTAATVPIPAAPPVADETPTAGSASDEVDDDMARTLMPEDVDITGEHDEPEEHGGIDEFEMLFGETVHVPRREPAPDLGDHDGATVAAADVRALRRDPAPAADAPTQVIPVQRGRVRVSTGQVVELDRTIIVGRRPRATRASGATLPHLIAVESPQQDISRNHLEVRPEGDTVVVVDLHATNGSTLLRAGAEPVRLHPGEATLVVDGDVVDLGDGVTLVFEDLP